MLMHSKIHIAFYFKDGPLARHFCVFVGLRVTASKAYPTYYILDSNVCVIKYVCMAAEEIVALAAATSSIE